MGPAYRKGVPLLGVPRKIPNSNHQFNTASPIKSLTPKPKRQPQTSVVFSSNAEFLPSLKRNIAGWNILCCNRKYIFTGSVFQPAMLDYRSVCFFYLFKGGGSFNTSSLATKTKIHSGFRGTGRARRRLCASILAWNLGTILELPGCGYIMMI